VGHVHTLFVQPFALRSDLSCRPQRGTEVGTLTRVETKVLLDLSEALLHVVHPIAAGFRAYRHAEERVVRRQGAAVESLPVVTPRQRERDGVRRHGGRLPAQHVEVEHRVDSVVRLSALGGGRPSCWAALQISLGPMSCGRCMGTPHAARARVVAHGVPHGRLRGGGEFGSLRWLLIRPRW
jgi:hypothetical protein